MSFAVIVLNHFLSSSYFAGVNANTRTREVGGEQPPRMGLRDRGGGGGLRRSQQGGATLDAFGAVPLDGGAGRSAGASRRTRGDGRIRLESPSLSGASSVDPAPTTDTCAD